MKRKALLIIVIIALLCAGYLVYKRYLIERNNRVVAFVVDFSDLKLLARRNDIPIDILLDKVRKTGVNGVAITADTVGSLNVDGKVIVIGGNEVAFFASQTVKIPPSYSCIAIHRNDKGLIDRIKYNLEMILGKSALKVFRYKDYVLIGLPVDRDNLMTMPVGFSIKDIKMVLNAGFNVILRPINWQDVPPIWYKDIIDFIDKSDVSRIVIFGGLEVLGYPSHIEDVARFMKERKLCFGEVEFSNQLGEKELALFMMPYLFRVHSISSDEMETIPVNKAIARYIRAIKERNMRVIYIRPFLRPMAAPVSENLDYFSAVVRGAIHSGFKVGIPRPLKMWWNVPYLVLVAILGIAAAMTIALEKFFRLSLKKRGIFFILFILIQANFFFQKGFVFAEQFSALLAAIVFPFLAVSSIYDDINVNRSLSVKEVVWSVIKVSGISMAGGIFIAGILGQTAFMLKVVEFRGVKLTYILPLLGILLYFYVRMKGWDGIKQLWNRPLYIQEFIGLLILSGAVAIYVLRSGNFSVVPVTSTEQHIRGLLEGYLWARPRFKEILIGYPALAILIILGYRGLKRYEPWFAMVAGVASISIVNSFCHIHTPVMYSLMRTLNGMWIGIIVVLLIIMLYRVFTMFVDVMRMPSETPSNKSKR